MASSAFFHDLEQRHAELDKQIGIEQTRRVPDLDAIARIKKEKRALKDKLTAH